MGLTTLLLATLTAAAPVHLPVSTNAPQVQTAVDRGLFLYYAYNGDDAARAFAQAGEGDPKLAMAYWGIALADGPDLNTPVTAERFALSAKAIRQAVALESNATPQDRGLIDAMAMRYRGTFADWKSNEAAYRQSMLALAQSSSSENVQLLTAETLLEDGGLAWSGGTLASDESRHGLALITNVLGTNPASVMANHLCIHLYDLAPDRSPALACARRLDAQTFEPEAEHLAHMPAHYWIETGDYEAALASSERAYTLLERLKSDEGGVEHTRRYAKHDVSVGYSAAMMRGNHALAQTWAGRMAAVYDLRFDALTALRFGRYADAYAAAGSQFGNPSVRGLAAISLGRLSEAHELATRVRAAANAGNGYLPQLFLARLAEADGKFDEARRWIAQAATNQRASFGGELIPFIPAQEALGGFYLRRNENAEAAAAFNAALEAYPNDPRALFGLAAALAADGKSAQAADARARFKAGWNGADTFLDGAAIE